MGYPETHPGGSMGTRRVPLSWEYDPGAISGMCPSSPLNELRGR